MNIKESNNIDNIKNKIKSLIEINEKIKNLKEQLKVVNENKNVIENNLIDKIDESTDIETNKFIISKKSKKTYESISKDFLIKSITNFINIDENRQIDTNNINEFIKYLYNYRNIKTQNYINIKIKK